jgi:uncharacterized protein involved in exopolysaccharide biosynthesis
LHQIDLTTVNSNRQALLNVLTMFQMRAIQTEVGSPFGARILSGPTTPDQANDPNVLAFLGGGALVGLLLSIFLILVSGLRVARDFDEPKPALPPNSKSHR